LDGNFRNRAKRRKNSEIKTKQNKKNECEEYPQKDSQWLLLVGFEIY